MRLLRLLRLLRSRSSTTATTPREQRAQYPQYPNGCSFSFYDGNGHLTTFTDSKYQDVVTPLGEVETFIGTGANSVPNNTKSFVFYDSKNTPNTPNQTALSFVSGKTTTNWLMAIAPNGDWGLTATFANASPGNLGMSNAGVFARQ